MFPSKPTYLISETSGINKNTVDIKFKLCHVLEHGYKVRDILKSKIINNIDQIK